MTKAEFFERRAKAHFLKTSGATQCPPGMAVGAMPPPLPAMRRAKNRWARVAATIVQHPRDEAGDSKPIRMRRTTGGW